MPIRNYLLKIDPLTEMVNNRIYAAADFNHLPPGYTPVGSGPTIAFKIRGGDLDYSSSIVRPSIQFQCIAATPHLAHTVARHLHTALHDQKTAYFKMAQSEGLGILLTVPETGWPFILSYFQFWIARK